MIRKYKIPFNTKGYAETIKIPQYDTGYEVVFDVMDLPEETTTLDGYSAVVEGSRSDGLAYEFQCTVSGTHVSFTIDTTCTGCPGRGEARIRFLLSGEEIAANKIIVEIEKSSVPNGAVDADTAEARSIAEQIQEIVDTAAEATAAAAQQIVDDLQNELSTVKEELQEYADIFTGDVDESVQNWLDEHPEATTTLQDGVVTEPKLTSALKNKILNPYVTPEMFGAAGNGSTDDTQAVQAALDAEANCCLVGQYKITDTLIWNKRGSNSKNIFSLTNVRQSDCCQLIFNLADRTKPCIEIQSDSLTIQNIGISGDNPRDQTLFKTNNTAVDIDFSIINCFIRGFDTIIDTTGRGLDMTDNVVTSCSVIAKVAWKTEGESVYHNDTTGQRAYNFCNNRFHSVGYTEKPLIQLTSGNLYGFRFVNNNIDRGYSSLLRAYGNARNWMISGNTFSGVMGYGSNLIFIGIDGAVEQVTISNNNFTQVETNTLTSRILSIGGAVNGLVFVGNSFGEIINTMLIYFGQNVKNSILNNNLLLKNVTMSTVRGLFTIAATLTMENTNICNNVVGEVSGLNGNTYNQYILRCSGALTLRNVKMMGNIRPLASVQSNVKDYSIGTPVIENCLFDWEL